MENQKENIVEQEEILAKAEIDLDTGETNIINEKGEPIEEKKLGEKVKHFLKKSFEYSPIGLSYTMSKGIMESSIQLLDRAINENELNKVEEIKFTDIINLIKEGKDKFKELDLTFNASKVNGINVTKIKEALGDKNVNIDLGKRGDLQLKIKVVYK
jgi:hypothetical protein